MKFLRVAQTLGTVFKVFSFLLWVPLLGSLYWDENVAASPVSDYLPGGMTLKATTASYLLTFVFVFLLGFLLTALSGRVAEDLREREAYFIVGAGWFLCAALGSIPFLLTRATDDPTIALFESMSGITTSGFSALASPLESYPESVHLWRGSLHLFGGLGVVLVLVAIIARLTEGAARLMSTETAGGDVTRLRPKLSQTAKSLFGVYVTFNVLVFLALWLALHYSGERLGWKTAAYHALVHAFGTIATGGMSTRTLSIEAFNSEAVNAVVFFFALASGVSFALYYRVFHGRWWELVRNAELRFYLVVILLASITMGGFLLYAGQSWTFAALQAPYAAITTITTTGYTSTNLDAFPDGAKLVLLLLMFTGGMVGSTAGGLKVARIYLLLRLTFQEVRRLLHPHAVSVVKLGGRIFPEDALRRIVVFFFSYVTIFIAGAMGFALLGFDFVSSLAASAATLGNVGYGFAGVAGGFADPVPEAARVLGTLLMWVGRLEIFAVLLLFVPGTYKD